MSDVVAELSSKFILWLETEILYKPGLILTRRERILAEAAYMAGCAEAMQNALNSLKK